MNENGPNITFIDGEQFVSKTWYTVGTQSHNYLNGYRPVNELGLLILVLFEDSAQSNLQYAEH